MSYLAQELSIVVDGVAVDTGMMPTEPLVRAVVVSLFTWRRARPDDELPSGTARMGWWGDSFASVEGDRIGSRLWLLARAKLTVQTINRAREYAHEALAWLVEDGVASRVEVEVERLGVEGIAMACRITRSDGHAVDLRFSNAWEFLSRV
jgi:phage gp46-like protein